MAQIAARNVVRYPLDSGMEAVRRAIARVLDDRARARSLVPVVVLVAGGSASGKTSQVAQKLFKYYEGKAVLLSVDDYYRGVAFMEKERTRGRNIHFDQPEALNLGLLRAHLISLREHVSIMKPRYSFQTGERCDAERVHPTPIIIVEGLFALHAMLADLGHIRIFVDVGVVGRIIRRLIRDVDRTSWSSADSLSYMARIAHPAQERYIEPTKENADFILENEFDARVEPKRSGLYRIQVKFSGALSSKQLDTLRAEMVASVEQLDTYYDPPDRDLRSTGEMIRTRREGDAVIFTYKGPRDASDSCGCGPLVSARPIVEFVLNEGFDVSSIHRLFNSNTVHVEKKRRVYFKDGVVLCNDTNVVRYAGGSVTALGDFVELRAAEDDRDRLLALVQRLGLRAADATTLSYIEM